MNKKHIIKAIEMSMLLAIIISSYVINLKIIYNVFLSHNIKSVNINFFELIMVFWFEILMFLFLWDIIMHRIQSEIKKALGQIVKYLIRIKKMRYSIWVVKIEYVLIKWTFLLTFGLYDKLLNVLQGRPNEYNEMWKDLTKSSIKFKVRNILGFIFSWHLFLAILAAAFSIKYLNVDVISKALVILDKYKVISISNIKLLSSATIVILIACIGFFVSFKGAVKRAIAQTNKKKMEEIIEKQRKLVTLIDIAIYKIVPNLEFAIENQDLVVDIWTNARFSENDWFQFSSNRMFNSENNYFTDIQELDEIEKEIEKLNLIENRSTLYTFARYKYEIFALISKFDSLDCNELNKIFFTNQGVNSLMKPMKYFENLEISDEVKEFKQNYIEEITEMLYQSLIMIYKFQRYYEEMDNLLSYRSDKVGRALRMFTGKE